MIAMRSEGVEKAVDVAHTHTRRETKQKDKTFVSAMKDIR